MAQSISIILPTLNEEQNIVGMIKQLNAEAKPLEIIVVDDDSKDRTRELASKAAKNVKVIRRTKEKGVASAIRTGLDASKGEIVAWMDADLSMPPKTLGEMISKITSGSCDVCVGSRYAGKGKDDRSLSRVVTSALLNSFAQLVLNCGVKDLDSGFVASRKKVLEKVSFDASGHGEYCIEFVYKAVKKGFRVKEAPYIFREREFGDSKTAANFLSLPFHGFKYCWRIIKIRFSG